VPWGYLLPRLLTGIDIRKHGSGNMGAANVWRAVGFKVGLAVAVLDVAKGFVPALLGRWLEGELVGLLAGMAAMAGHWRPLFLGFGRGGKIVATTGGVGFALAPLASLAAGAVWIATFLLTRYTSVASMASAIALSVCALLFGASWPVVTFTVGAAVVIIFLHRANIVRLARGTESRFKLRRRSLTAAEGGESPV
jgi:glycerol-3-phosphate acyltransferase PlsY